MTVSNNTCYNNKWNGILHSSSSSSIIINNICNNNDYDGIRLSSSESLTIINNTCNNNNVSGIYFFYSDLCVVIYNLIQENEVYGVILNPDSDNNIFHHNTFVDNNLGGTSQAHDTGSNNIWHDSETLEGNYWSDWSGTGSYSIDGSAEAIDLYPLDEEGNPPVVPEYDSLSLFTLLILVFPLLLTIVIYRKRKKIA